MTHFNDIQISLALQIQRGITANTENSYIFGSTVHYSLIQTVKNSLLEDKISMKRL